MLIGIDVGGTFTDGVLFAGQEVKKAVKRPTDNNNLQTVILGVLDDLLAAVPAHTKVQRIVLKMCIRDRGKTFSLFGEVMNE